MVALLDWCRECIAFWPDRLEFYLLSNHLNCVCLVVGRIHQFEFNLRARFAAQLVDPIFQMRVIGRRAVDFLHGESGRQSSFGSRVSGSTFTIFSAPL